ncbi:MAG: hypothetical protein E7657_03220 [Ruminococcaceae bacterium]|nr:hypothetical protein [Oscillospiraceae bacterium]
MKICYICKEEFTSTRENASLCDACEKKMTEGITIEFPKGCQTIKEGMLESRFLYRLEIPDTVTTVKSSFGIFLEEVVIPDSVTEFDPPLSFRSDCLRTVKLGRGVKEIPQKLFLGKRVLSAVTLSEGLTDIGSNAFFSCAALETLKIPTTVTRIGDSAFAKSGLRELELGSAIRHVGQWAFKEADKLASVRIASEEGLTLAREAFADCQSLKAVTLSGRVREIAGNAFRGCSALKEISLPRETAALGDGVFSGCADGLIVRYGGTKEEWIALAVYQTKEGKETVAGPLDHYPYYKAGGETTKSFEYTVKFDRGIHHLTVICADGTVLTYGELAWSK